MTVFSAYATNFEMHPTEGAAFQHLSPLLRGLGRVDFNLRVDDPSVNQGQMTSDFDDNLEHALHLLGATPCSFRLPDELPQELDFAFEHSNATVAVEIEKANREKILRDFLKCHMYLHSGAHYALVVLPRNYPHSLGVWNLFEFGVQRFNECRAFGFGTSDRLERILLLGFTQFDAANDEPMSRRTRARMRTMATKDGGA